MRKLFCWVCIVALLLYGCSVTEPETTTAPESKTTTEPEQTENNTHDLCELIFRAKLVSNNQVGNDWAISYKLDGKPVKNGHRVLLPRTVMKFQTVEVEIRENDKRDDVGTGKIELILYPGCSAQTTVEVVETGGRYKGRKAVWEVTCSAKLVSTQ